MKLYTIFAVAVIVVLSGCSLDRQQTQATKQQTDTQVRQQDTNIDVSEYTFGVDHTVDGETIEVTLRPHEESVRFFENTPETTLWTYSTGQTPIVVRAQQGDTLEVTVENTLSQETSVHWHGIRVPNSQDGVPGVTQEPIAPGATYEYTIPLQDEGTFFFHPHINTVEQMGRGLYGVLIVESKEPAYTYDEEIILSLKDYRLNRDGSINTNFDNMMDFTHGGRLGNVLTVNNLVQPTFDLAAGDTVLLRLLNPSNARIYNFDLRHWNAQVVGTDGGPVAEPYAPTVVQLSPGERMNMLVKVEQEPLQLVDRYFGDPFLLATLQPEGTSENNNIVLDNEDFPDIPDWSEVANREPDEVIDLGGIGVMGGDRNMMAGGGIRGWTINDGVWPKTNEQLTRKQGELRVVRLQNKSRRDHPMHLHGDFFQVVGVNGKQVPWHGWKDTINVPPQGYVDLALIPTNPGTWMFHCHIIEHADFGMMTTIKVE